MDDTGMPDLCSLPTSELLSRADLYLNSVWSKVLLGTSTKKDAETLDLLVDVLRCLRARIRA
jgi:hypothetical protein